MTIKIQHMRHFLMVAQAGGFRAASAKANRSQAALSTSIKNLETLLGQALFSSHHKSQLTPFGELCLPKITQFLTLYDDLNHDLRAAATGQIGKVRIASVPSLAAKFIPRILALYTALHPQVEVSLIDDNAAGVEARLLAGEVDLALGNQVSIHHDRIDFTALMTDPVGVVCRSDHPLAQYTEGLSWQQLQGYPFIRNGTCILLEKSPLHTLSQQALYSIKNITSLFSVLELDIGITTLPKLAFPDYSDKLIWLPLIEPKLQRQMGVFRISDRDLSPQAWDFYHLCLTNAPHFKEQEQ